MNDMQQHTGGSLGQRIRVGCVGLLLLAGVVLLALGLIAQSRPDATPLPVELPATMPVGPVVETTAEARAPSGKILPAATPGTAKLVVPSQIVRRAAPESADEDYDALMAATLPVHDHFATAQRLGQYDLGERQVPAEPMTVGQRQTFQTADGPRQADLIHLTGVAAYWVETGLGLDRTAIAEAAGLLESRYLLPMQAIFGREWSPGVDQDPRISILHTLGSPDAVELGYFSDENQFPRALFAQSNEREMVYLNMSRLEVGSDHYLGTILHELQHLSQWNLDANEQVWLNEGLSQVAETMSGLETVDPSAYQQQPGIRLDSWSNAPEEVYAHYAASYLYVLYLWQRAGEAAVRELVRHPAGGLGSMADVLEGHAPGVSLMEFTADWAVANYLDGRGGEKPFAYDRLDLPPMGLATRARRLPFSTLGELDQYAADVIDLDLSGPVRLTFVGDTVTALVESPPPNGERFWYAPLDNSSAPALAAEVALSGPADADPRLTFDMYFDLEVGWDYAYLLASTDGGETWRPLSGMHSVPGPFGPAWNGRSMDLAQSQDGWIRESVSLAEVDGQVVQLRLEALSDLEGPSRGLAITSPQVEYADGMILPIAWRAEGFAETGWLLPQYWGVRVVRDGAPAEVITLITDESGQAQVDLSLGSEGGAILVLPLTAPSFAPARYWIGVESLAAPAEN